MRVLVTGATGFIGAQLVQRLLADGHEVVACSRHAAMASQQTRSIECDYRCDHTPEIWMARLEGVDAVVNTVGILQEQQGQRFDSLHVKAPQALFQACVRQQVRRVIQLSALGADEGAKTPYHCSKKAADDYLRGLDLDWTILQPSLVFGPTGQSARLFGALASMPILFVPGYGRQCVQPVHISDLVEAIVRLLKDGVCVRQTVAAVGPRPLAFQAFLQALRAAMGLPQAPVLATPLPVLRLVASVLRYWPRSLLSPDAISMLERGNCADVAPFTALLRRSPRTVEAFIPVAEQVVAHQSAVLQWGLPLLRFSLAIVWFAAALTSAFFFPHAESYALLARSGVPTSLQPLLLWSAIATDALFGAATLWRPHRYLWLAQIALVTFYSVLIAWQLPEFWQHPYGPLIKNLPILAILILLLALDSRRGH